MQQTTETYKHTPQGDLQIHLHFPADWQASDRRPAIVFFFGGGWVNGTVEQFRPQAEYLASRGLVAARADYRVKNRQGTLAECCVEDGKSAVRWLRVNAARLGIDPERIIGSGGSAGGHVAACAALSDGFDGPGEDHSVSARPNLLVLHNPVLDGHWDASRFGSAEAASAASPCRVLRAGAPATLLMYGDRDQTSNLDQPRRYIEAATACGAEAECAIAPGVGHGFFNNQPWRDATIRLADQFLVRHGYLTGEPTVAQPDDAQFQPLAT